MNEECIFCKLVSEGEKIYENDNFFSIFDINPKVEGHALVISKKHFENVLEMPNTLGTEFFDCVKKTSMKVMGDQKAEGMNLVVNTMKAAGQLVDHFHAHILPRKKEDSFSIGV